MTLNDPSHLFGDCHVAPVEHGNSLVERNSCDDVEFAVECDVDDGALVCVGVRLATLAELVT